MCQPIDCPIIPPDPAGNSDENVEWMLSKAALQGIIIKSAAKIDNKVFFLLCKFGSEFFFKNDIIQKQEKMGSK